MPAWQQPIVAQIPTRDATPTAQDMFERPAYPDGRPSMPQVSGFQRRAKPGLLKPWMLVVGALIMAGLAFAITRMFIR
jgi:hypothetical protein